MMAPILRAFLAGYSLATDRSVRFLGALGGASTSRVLNLLRIAADNAGQSGTSAKSRFSSRPSSTGPSCSSTAPAPTRPICSPARARWRPRSSFPSTPTICAPAAARCSWTSAAIPRRCARRATISDEALERDLAVLRLLDAVPVAGSLPAARASAQQQDRGRALLFRHLRGRPGAHAPLRQPGNVAADRCWPAAAAVPVEPPGHGHAVQPRSTKSWSRCA